MIRVALSRLSRMSLARGAAVTAFLVALSTVVACGSSDSSAPTFQDSLQSTSASVTLPTPTPDLTFAPNDERRALRFRELEGWQTDFTQKTVGLDEFRSVLPRDGIMPIDSPVFSRVGSAPSYMSPREPVIALEIDGDARAYPLAMLMWHEMVNDTVGATPVTVTFCPLCNSAVTFVRIVDGEELTFGTTGKLRNSDLVMWDRQTESWWQQITGEALVGRFAAEEARLEVINAPIVAWEDFASQYPDGLVMERIFDDLGFPVARYDLPPYAGYDSVDASPFAIDGELDDRLPPNVRVLTFELDSLAVAYPFSDLERQHVVNDTVGEKDVVIFFENGALSAFVDELDGRLEVGAATVFSREVDGVSLTFSFSEEGIRDAETGSIWNSLGYAVEGELTGERLSPVVHANHFWFAWAVFKPDTEIRTGASVN